MRYRNAISSIEAPKETIYESSNQLQQQIDDREKNLVHTEDLEEMKIN